MAADSNSDRDEADRSDADRDPQGDPRAPEGAQDASEPAVSKDPLDLSDDPIFQREEPEPGTGQSKNTVLLWQFFLFPLLIVAVVVGTDEDPQDMELQIKQLEAAGAWVETSNDAAVRYVGRLVQALGPRSTFVNPKPVDLAVFHQPLSAINVGLESFAESLQAQGAPVIQMDWRPPAGGNEKLMAILERMAANNL